MIGLDFGLRSYLLVSPGLSLSKESLTLLSLGLRAVLQEQLEERLCLVLVQRLCELVERCMQNMFMPHCQSDIVHKAVGVAMTAPQEGLCLSPRST